MKYRLLFWLILLLSFFISWEALAGEEFWSGDIQPSINESKARSFYETAEVLYNHGRYEEAAAYYNMTNEICKQQLTKLQSAMDGLRLNLTEIYRQQEELNATYAQNEKQYSNQQMMENALTETIEALITEFIPFQILPDPLGDLAEGAETAASVPGVIGTLENTRDALVWNSQGRNQNRDSWSDLENLRLKVLADYSVANLETARISNLIQLSLSGLSRIGEAMGA